MSFRGPFLGTEESASIEKPNSSFTNQDFSALAIPFILPVPLLPSRDTGRKEGEEDSGSKKKLG
jgi:hypothetical protein